MAVRQTKDMLNSIIYKLLVIKHEKICVVYWSGVGVPGRKLLGWWNSIECMAEGMMEGGGPGEIKREVILLLLHVLIHLLWCYYSFHFHLLARHTRNVHTWCSTPLNASSHPQFSWWNELLIHLHYNDVKPQDFSFPFPSAWTSHFSA